MLEGAFIDGRAGGPSDPMYSVRKMGRAEDLYQEGRTLPSDFLFHVSKIWTHLTWITGSNLKISESCTVGYASIGILGGTQLLLRLLFNLKNLIRLICIPCSPRVGKVAPRDQEGYSVKRTKHHRFLIVSLILFLIHFARGNPTIPNKTQRNPKLWHI